MGYKYREEDVDRLLEEADIIETIFALTGESVKRGKNFPCINPLDSHADKSPSMGLIPHKEVCHCFTCGYTANSLKLIRDSEGLGFIEGLERLADIMGNPDYFVAQTQDKTKMSKPTLVLTKPELELLDIHLPSLIPTETALYYQMMDEKGVSYKPSGDKSWLIRLVNTRVHKEEYVTDGQYLTLIQYQCKKKMQEIELSANSIKVLSDFEFSVKYEITEEFLAFYYSSIPAIRNAMIQELRNEYGILLTILDKVRMHQEKIAQWERTTPEHIKKKYV